MTDTEKKTLREAFVKKAGTETFPTFYDATPVYRVTTMEEIVDSTSLSKDLRPEAIAYCLTLWMDIEEILNNEYADNANYIYWDSFDSDSTCETCEDARVSLSAAVCTYEEDQNEPALTWVLGDYGLDDMLEEVIEEIEEDGADSAMDLLEDELVCEGHAVFYSSEYCGSFYHNTNDNSISPVETLSVSAFTIHALEEALKEEED